MLLTAKAEPIVECGMGGGENRHVRMWRRTWCKEIRLPKPHLADDTLTWLQHYRQMFPFWWVKHSSPVSPPCYFFQLLHLLQRNTFQYIIGNNTTLHSSAAREIIVVFTDDLSIAIWFCTLILNTPGKDCFVFWFPGYRLYCLQW